MYEIIFRILKFVRNGIISLLIVMILYLAVAIAASAIPVNRDQPQGGEITIYLRTNGMHTSFVFPLRNDIMDWTELIKPEHILSKNLNSQYISFGWGDLKFYRNTPEWSDVKFPVAFQAVFLSNPSALHVEFHDTLRHNQPTIPVTITKEQYLQLVQYVSESFQRDLTGKIQPVTGLHYNENDVFYHANRSLHFFYTCNTWVNEGLKKAGLRACLWTPFDEGIFYQYR